MPTTADLTAGTVMDDAAAHLNDSAKTIYTYTVQIPYLNIAVNELKELFELNNIPVTATVSAALPIDSGVTSIGFSPTPPIVGVTYLPDDLIEPVMLWERPRNTDPYIPMSKVGILPEWQQGVQINQFIWYVWQSQEIRFMAANQDNDIKMNYIKNIFATVATSASTLNVVNARSFLGYRTAALIAGDIMQDDAREEKNNNSAAASLDRVLGIGTKGRQAIFTRRRPFRQAFKMRTYG